MSDGNLPASGRKIAKAKNRGNVARSPELVSEAVLLWGLFVVTLTLSSTQSLLAWFRNLLTQTLDLALAGSPSPGQMVRLLATGLAPGLAVLGLIFLGTLALAGVIGQFVSGGTPISWEVLTPRPERFNVVAGLQRLFRPAAMGNAALALVKLLLALGVFILILPQGMRTVMGAGAVRPQGILDLVSVRLRGTGFALGGTLLAMAALQAVWARKRWTDELKMNQQEAMDDAKEAEGSPVMKKRHRQAHRRLARRRTLAAVASADVVLANPTHVAVALKYKRGQMRAPRVVAKGADLMAVRIKEMARQLGVPVVEQPPLARELYASVDVGKEVPVRLYRAVARVIGQIQKWRAPQFAAAPGRTA